MQHDAAQWRVVSLEPARQRTRKISIDSYPRLHAVAFHSENIWHSIVRRTTRKRSILCEAPPPINSNSCLNVAEAKSIDGNGPVQDSDVYDDAPYSAYGNARIRGHWKLSTNKNACLRKHFHLCTWDSPTCCRPPIRLQANPFESRREPRRRLTPHRIWKCPHSRALEIEYK